MVKINKSFITRVAFIATALAFIVVTLGAYTRLKDAGLGCPDWPGCYGQIKVPETSLAIASAQKLFPNQPVEPTKAWAEMIHRYFAGSLVLLILALALCCYYRKKEEITQTLKAPLLLVGCVFFQAMLGMWTVTLQLHPLIVMGHLLCGMTIAALLWWVTLDSGQFVSIPPINKLISLKPFILGGVIIVFLQIFLGGWTSANYASIICPDFPYCQGQLFPALHFTDAFNLFRPLGQNYQGGSLGSAARITIQMMHRYGAFIVFGYISFLGCYVLFARRTYALKNTMGMVFIILGTQMFLGILNIATSLYLPIAVTHNAVALLLLLSMVTLFYQVAADPRKMAHKVVHEPNHLQRGGELAS